MVHVPRVDGSAPVEEEFGDFDGAGKVQRGLAIAAACMNELRFGGDEFP